MSDTKEANKPEVAVEDQKLPPDTEPLRFVEFQTWPWEIVKPAYPRAEGVVELNEFIHNLRPALEDSGFTVIQWRNVSTAS